MWRVIYLLERLWVGLSGVVGHIWDVGLMEVGVKGQSIQRQISVGVRGVGGVQLCGNKKKQTGRFAATAGDLTIKWTFTPALCSLGNQMFTNDSKCALTSWITLAWQRDSGTSDCRSSSLICVYYNSNLQPFKRGSIVLCLICNPEHPLVSTHINSNKRSTLHDCQLTQQQLRSREHFSAVWVSPLSNTHHTKWNIATMSHSGRAIHWFKSRNSIFQSRRKKKRTRKSIFLSNAAVLCTARLL